MQAAVVTVPFEVTPGNDSKYVKDTVERLATLGVKAWVYYFAKEEIEKPESKGNVSVEETGSYLEAVSKASEKAMELLRG